jgi:hypothetical protein
MFPKHSFGNVFGLVVDVLCTQVPPDDQEMERRFGFIFWILIQHFVHDARSVASVRQSLHRAFSLKSLYSCGSCRYSDAYECAQSPTQTAEMAILVCSTLSIFFYLTYFIKMHDSSATFMIILEYAAAAAAAAAATACDDDDGDGDDNYYDDDDDDDDRCLLAYTSSCKLTYQFVTLIAET